jgi:hypothetical protein
MNDKLNGWIESLPSEARENFKSEVNNIVDPIFETVC